MPDLTDKDKNNLWAQMPPTRKNKPPVQLPPQMNRSAEPQSAQNNSTEDKKKKSKRKAQKSDKKSAAAKKQAKKGGKPKNTDTAVPVPATSKAQPMPKYVSDNTATDIPVAKPMDIQSRALRHKSNQRRGETTPEKNGRRTRRKLSSYLLYYIMFGIIAVVIICVLSTTVLFNIEHFEVTGDDVYTQSEVLDALGVSAGENLILLDSSAAEQRLIEALPYIDKASVIKKLPSTLQIEIGRAEAVANIKKNNSYYLVSANGRIMNAELTKPDSKYVVVTGFDPEYAASGDFLSVANESSRNMLCKLLSSVKNYAELDGQTDISAEKKYDILFDLIGQYTEVGFGGKIKEIDISNIYNITMNYDNKLTLQLGDYSEIKLKLTVAKNLIDKGEFDGEKGILILSQVASSSDSMKVTFRPDYDDTSSDSSTSDNSSSDSTPPDGTSSQPSDSTDSSGADIGDTTPPT